MEVVIANEVIWKVKVKRKECIIFKVDFEKIYDSVKWSFLYYMLKRCDFCYKWITCTKGCVESSTISFLVNGIPT